MARRANGHAFLLLSRLSLWLLAAPLALSCASTDDASGGVFSQEAAVISEQLLICACGACIETTCADVVCGTSRDCCIPRPKNDGLKCSNVAGQTGTCAGGECCFGCIERLKDGSSVCQPGDQPAACGAPGGSCTNCDDGNPCTEDACDPRLTGRCSSTILADQTPCPSGICGGGVCCKGCIDEQGLCQPGNLPAACGLGGGKCAACSDENLCTDDVCSAGQCQNSNRPNGSSCETDSNVCTGISTCQTGTCAANSELNCDDGNLCTNDMCDPVQGCKYANNTIACTDGNPCTTGDACSAGSCRAGPSVVCDDNEVCTTDTCNPLSGCVYAPRANGIVCNDFSECTTASACSAGKCMGGPGELICDDMKPCTRNNCSPLNGVNSCSFTQLEPVNTPCVTDKCFVNTVCDAQGVCGGGMKKDCDDKNPCTRDECNPTTGACVNSPLNAACNDGSICTLNDSCRAGTCTGDAVECAPLDDCHVGGTCNEASGVCDDPRAEDGAPCAAGTGACAAGRCVTTPIPPAEGGAGGADSTPEAGATASGGSAGDTGDAGAGATPGSGGRGTSAGGTSAGQGGRTPGNDAERGPTFSRKPGGCDCSLPRNDAHSNALLFLTASLFGAAHRRRRMRRETAPAID